MLDAALSARWTQTDIASLRALQAVGTDLTGLTKALGRSVDDVSRMVRRLRLPV